MDHTIFPKTHYFYRKFCRVQGFKVIYNPVKIETLVNSVVVEQLYLLSVLLAVGA